ncbi:hypothetical protein RAC89_08540 [Paenibacillus sp. GD4]|uniref:hypothetical protein n=1 Tax=Paenibacillus sp. GD4 TaxID=3068890 RepID=UPI0027967BD6|nr:hypothetical protein [Paenibacillus sp. GD4]MDQ1910547.1 hypothetical protein [Paenibacillus sp. GD4]
MMLGEQLQTLVLIKRNGDKNSFKFHKLWREDTQEQLFLELEKGNKTFRFAVTQSKEGITDLVDDKGENFRVLGVCRNVPAVTHEKEYRFQIADSYHNALDLIKFI